MPKREKNTSAVCSLYLVPWYSSQECKTNCCDTKKYISGYIISVCEWCRFYPSNEPKCFEKLTFFKNHSCGYTDLQSQAESMETVLRLTWVTSKTMQEEEAEWCLLGVTWHPWQACVQCPASAIVQALVVFPKALHASFFISPEWRQSWRLCIHPIDSLFHRALSVRWFTEMAVKRSNVDMRGVKADYCPTAP